MQQRGFVELCQALQPCRKVDRIADHGTFHAVGFTECSEHHHSRVDADADADRIVTCPQASHLFHAEQYLLGNQNLDNLKNFV